MPEQVNSKKKVFKVILSKTFEYPACSVDERDTLYDLHQKAVSDFLEKAASGKCNPRDFDIRLDQELPFKVRRQHELTKEERRKDSFNGDWFIRQLVEYEMEEKYGPLDHEANPSIYDIVEPEDDDDDVQIYLKEEIEVEMNNLLDRYYKILRGKFLC
jgi:hypothetical protein